LFFERKTSPAAHRRCRGGFTLVELLIVIVIITILIGLLLSAGKVARDSTRAQATEGILKTLYLGIEAYRRDFGRLPPALPRKFDGYGKAVGFHGIDPNVDYLDLRDAFYSHFAFEKINRLFNAADFPIDDAYTRGGRTLPLDPQETALCPDDDCSLIIEAGADGVDDTPFGQPRQNDDVEIIWGDARQINQSLAYILSGREEGSSYVESLPTQVMRQISVDGLTYPAPSGAQRLEIVDAFGQIIFYDTSAAGGVVLRSAGRDTIFGTDDDVFFPER
jgi:prepilin-type N-terminal cleavage/methylation domain-containing protein